MYDGTGHPEAVRTFAILLCQPERAKRAYLGGTSEGEAMR